MRASEIGEYQAEIIVKNGLKAFGLSEEELLVTPYSHPSKLIIALAVRQSTLVPYAWISNRLHMGIPKSMGTLLHRAKKNGRNGFENEGVDRAPELLTSVPPME